MQTTVSCVRLLCYERQLLSRSNLRIGHVGERSQEAVKMRQADRQNKWKWLSNKLHLDVTFLKPTCLRHSVCVCPRQVSATGQLVSSGAAAITSRATFVSIDSVECMLEQSVCGSSRAIGAWSVTVSNNGALQSTQSLLYVIYDSNCFTCTSTSCSPRVHTVFWMDIWF